MKGLLTRDESAVFFYTYLRSASFCYVCSPCPSSCALHSTCRRLQLPPVGVYRPLLYRLKSTPCERPALQGFTSSALLHNTIALPIPNAVYFVKFLIFLGVYFVMLEKLCTFASINTKPKCESEYR